MTRSTKHARIPHFPFVGSLRYARLDAIREEPARSGSSLVLDYQELVHDAPPQLVKHNGALAEHLQGHYVPRRLRFTGITSLKRTGPYTDPDMIPLDHSARRVQGILCWYPPERTEPFYLLENDSTEPASLLLSARQCVAEGRPGPESQVTFTQSWSSPPLLPAGLVPDTKQLLGRYGGDPITFHLGNRLYHRRFFIGGVDRQPPTRPDVDVILNLGEKPSRWSPEENAPQDRWDVKGEGTQGMSLDELAEEARWVAERLRSGQRVLVHCAAGFNRSATVCCATLILLEKLAAESALQRVREHHPFARPDPNHWLALRWLAQQST